MASGLPNYCDGTWTLWAWCWTPVGLVLGPPPMLSQALSQKDCRACCKPDVFEALPYLAMLR